MFDHQSFSKYMKLALADYFIGESVDQKKLRDWVQMLSDFSPKSLQTDDKRKSFWINVYNALTNYYIITHSIKKSVWEVPGFFRELKVKIGEFDWSLDDIEHGILRQNGPRKNDRPKQFKPEDQRCELMVKNLDPRIHFALNCGSISCPPIAFYSAENIDQELALAEESFASQEFQVDHQKRVIQCSEIFIWYRQDFVNQYLNSDQLQNYQIYAIPYRWTIA